MWVVLPRSTTAVFLRYRLEGLEARTGDILGLARNFGPLGDPERALLLVHNLPWTY